MIRETSGSDILSDDMNWLGALLVDISIPRPPVSLVGPSVPVQHHSTLVFL